MNGGFPAHGGNLAWAAERYRRPGDRFLDFSANVNPLGPSPRALEAARAALSGVSRYPEPDAAGLRGELAAYLGTNPGMLTLGNGSTELIHHLVRCLAPRRVAVATPAFGEYERAARAAGAEIDFFQLAPEEGFALDPEGFAAMASGNDLTFFCNPASPSGRLYRREELLPALRACRERGGVLVVDESFMGFCTGEEAAGATLLPEAGGGGLAILSTFTKLFALAGLRGPGWLAGARDMVEALEERAVPWRVNAVAAAAARASLADAGYLRETRGKVAAWREDFARRLREAGPIRVYPSRTNYLLLGLDFPGLDAASLADGLGECGILVRNCCNFRGLEEGFIRVAVRTPPDNLALLDALEKVSKEGRRRAGGKTRREEA